MTLGTELLAGIFVACIVVLIARKVLPSSSAEAPMPDSPDVGFDNVEYPVIDETPWGVPVLDVQPMTQDSVSVTRVEAYARNAISYAGTEGRELGEQELKNQSVVPLELRFKTDGQVHDGVLFAPRAMEDKWAIYVDRGRVLFVRSWLRELVATADLVMVDGAAIVGPIRGRFVDVGDDAYQARVAEYLLRDVGLGEGLPTPLAESFEPDHPAAASFCMGLFGRAARFATHHAPDLGPPERVLATVTALHIAAAQGDRGAAAVALESGIPIDTLATDGLTALQWVSSAADIDMASWLVERGAAVDARSRQGATALMQAVQGRSLQHVSLFLNAGADPNAVDDRGFTALHRAAEKGELAIVERLLDAGAAADVVADGTHTPESLASQSEHPEILELLRAAHTRR